MRPPKPLFDRVKLPLILAGFLAVSEWVDPLPFRITAPARVAALLFLLFALREVHHARLEVDEEWGARTDRVATSLRHRLRVVPRETWLKLQRVAVWTVMALVLGAILDVMTDRCEGAIQCTVLAPRMAMENIPTFVQFALYMAISLAQLGMMFYAMVKVGSFKVVMPGTIPVTFDDVWGQDKAKAKVMEQVRLLENSDQVENAGGFMPKGLLLHGPPGTGKRLAASQLVLTPEGYRRADEIEPGDSVYAADGLPTIVEAIFPSEIKPIFRVTFSDGSSARVDGEHLWGVYDREQRIAGQYVVRTTNWIGERLTCGDHVRFSIPLTRPVEFPERPLSLDPYLLGVLLGDGSFRCRLSISSRDREILRAVASTIPRGDYLMPLAKTADFGINGGRTRQIVRDLGLWGRTSHDKFVPIDFLWNTTANRLALLRGLLDTDGCLEKNNGVTYSSASPFLRDAVRFLVESLGGFVVSERPKKGESVEMRLKVPVNPFRLHRKRSRWNTPQYNVSRRVVSVEPNGEEGGVCLKVAHPRGLFLLERFIVTHNTYLAKAAANYSSKPLILVPPGAFQATFVGINLLKVWTLFRIIRKLARRYGGVIVFIDEIDSLGNRGGDVEQGATPPASSGAGSACLVRPAEPAPMVITGGGGQMGTLEAFLSAMDGMEDPRGALNRLLVFLGFKPLKPPDYAYIMMGATNMLGRLDPALLRAGRFGRKIHVTHPKADGRLKTYEGYLGKVKHSLTPENIEWAARSHARGTGAEIRDIVNEALLITYRDDRDTPGVIALDDLTRAMMWVKFGESDGPFERTAGRWGVAVHEAGHAVAFHHLNRDRELIWFCTIEQHGRAGGMVAPTPIREDWLLMRSEMLADIQVSLASRVAEELILGEQSNGHGGDGEAATDLAAKMVRLGHAPGQIGTYDQDAPSFRRAQEAILGEALDKTTALLSDRRDEIEAVARLLDQRGTVPGDEIHRLLDEVVA